MSEEWSVPGWAGLTLVVVLAVAVLVALGLARSARRARQETERQLLATRAEGEALRRQVEAIEHRMSVRAGSDEREHVITSMGEPGQGTGQPDRAPVAASTPTVGGALFADLVLRESVVQAAAVAAGVRRALAPEHRHRIRLEMKREVKRARKQRRADVRAARREVAARDRARPGSHDLDTREARDGRDGAGRAA